jgi:hypothetical protein
MSQLDPDPDRYESRGRKERTPAQLAVLAQAREKAKIVIAERAKLNALQKTVPSPEPVSEEVPLPPPPPPPEPEPEPEPEEPLPPPTHEHVSQPENEDEEPRLTRREVGEMIQRTMSQRPSPKYHYINGMYIKIK